MAKSFIDVVQDSPRAGLGIAVKTEIRGRTLFRQTDCRASQGRNKAVPPPNDTDSQVRPRRRTAGAGPNAISTGPRCCCALHAHRTPSSSSPGYRMTRSVSIFVQTGA